MEETTRRWPDPQDGPFLLTLRWSRVDGRPQVSGLHIDPLSDDMPRVTTSLLRDLRFAEIMIEDREKLKHVEPPRTAPDVQISGMRAATVNRLKRAANIYLHAWREGLPPTKEVAQRMNLTPAAAANLVRRAREAGLLPPTSSGVSQG